MNMAVEHISIFMNEILIVCSILFIAGCALIFTSINWRIKARQSLLWEKAEGIIIDSRVIESSMGSSDVGRSVSYKAFIQYTYTVNGVQYSSERVFWGESLQSSRKAPSKQLISRFPKGEKVVVFFCPSNPKESVLIYGYYNDNIIISLVSGILLAISGIVVYFLIR